MDTRATLPGLVVCTAIAGVAFALAGLPAIRDGLHLSPLLLVILLGMLWRSAWKVPLWAGEGIRAAQRPILRWAVAGLGFRLSLVELGRIGAPALAVVVVSTAIALFAGVWIARRLGVAEKLALLLGVGGAVCGASAVVAADTVVRGDRRDAPLALGVITLLGTVGILVYPPLGRAAGMSDRLYGVWDGASLHEMAQVVAAGFGMSDEAARVATVVKLARICLLAPIVLGLGMWLRRRAREVGEAHVSVVPWFLVAFLAFAALNSSGALGEPVLDALRRADLWLLCIGMAGVGLQTGFRDLREAGWRPVAAGAAQWLVLAAVSYALARALT
jgi:uncharacterized integral membrane protein (TIGR00698 family)